MDTMSGYNGADGFLSTRLCIYVAHLRLLCSMSRFLTSTLLFFLSVDFFPNVFNLTKHTVISCDQRGGSSESGKNYRRWEYDS